MNKLTALKIIESLRLGIPPDGNVTMFTYGRDDEISDLKSRLKRKDHGALIIQADYGSGKTHLLKFIREHALNSNYAVSYVTLDANSDIRFNRLDQILGAVCRNIDIPTKNKYTGVGSLFEFASEKVKSGKNSNSNTSFWKSLSNNRLWDYSEVFESPSIYIAFRAWCFAAKDRSDLITDWLNFPWKYYSKRKILYEELVVSLSKYFRDRRPDWKFYDLTEGIFNFQNQSYDQSWSFLRDLNRLAIESGLNGLILIFDEFEDVIYNIKNINHKESAFWNLFYFCFGKYYPGMTFYAFTPDLTERCKKVLIDKGKYGFDFEKFENLPKFQMSALEIKDLKKLASKILSVYNVAYELNIKEEIIFKILWDKLVKSLNITSMDRSRTSIKEIVKYFDEEFQN